MKDTKTRVLLIEDDQIDQMAFKRFVKAENLSYDYIIAGSVSEAKSVLDSEKFDIVILDYLLGDGTAFDLFDSIIDTPMIFATGVGDEELAVKAMKGGAYDYLVKDSGRNYLKVLPVTVENAINHNKAKRELEEKTRQLESVLDSTGDAIAMFDLKGGLLFANRWYQKMFEFTDQQLREMSTEQMRQQMKEFFQEPDLFDAAENSFLANPEKVFEDVTELKLSERRMVYRFTAPVRDAEENVVGRILVYRDISKELELDQMKAEVSRLRAELEMEYAFDNLIGKSRKMREMFALMQQVLESDITVLIQGESGTGKELVAKALHFNSLRKKGPFIPVNCAAIPENLIESEFFGHERGAFTGANTRRIGKFEAANKGTIFLDEIGEMPHFLQAKLLRVLQEREIQRVGGTAIIPVDVRIISATNKDLSAAMKAGEFREDLFYRLATFPILIPPLKERRDDIPLLAEHFLKKYTARMSKPIKGISAKALQMLVSYDWPGNVRELENAIERATLLEASAMLQASNLPPQIHSAHPQIYTSTPENDQTTFLQILSLEDAEKQAIVQALKATGNNIQQSAKALGIGRATLYRKLDKYRLLENRSPENL
ncbi:MAG: sigma 54-interacting transcriptional regulator [Ignavibacteria bacterium]|nr:sigma 54-interacting transcriptional regulator [Ignavibacteria bacterium]